MMARFKILICEPVPKPASKKVMNYVNFVIGFKLILMVRGKTDAMN